MSAYRRIRVAPIAPALGADVTGVDLASGPDDRALAEIRRAFDAHLLLRFRGQDLDEAAQLRFSAAFGAPMRLPYIEPLATHPEIIAVLKEADERSISVFGGMWHADFSFLAQPPGASILYALEVPEQGGDTLWASGYAAYDALSGGMRALLDRLEAMHSGHVYGAARSPTASGLRVSRSIGISRNNPEADVEHAHPVVALHPRSGRRTLFVNPIYTTRLRGMSERESAPLLRFLYAHATRPEFACRLRWRAGDVVVWDNRCTLHLAINDYDGQRRLLHRTAVAGGGVSPAPRAAAAPGGH